MSADPKAEEEEVQRFLELAREDLRKEIDTSLREVHQAANNASGPHGLARAMARFASFLGVLSKKADAQATENNEMQEKVVSLTNRLFWLTLALGLVAIAQICLAYLQLKEAKVSNRNYQHAQDAERVNSKDNVQDNKK